MSTANSRPSQPASQNRETAARNHEAAAGTWRTNEWTQRGLRILSIATGSLRIRVMFLIVVVLVAVLAGIGIIASSSFTRVSEDQLLTTMDARVQLAYDMSSGHATLGEVQRLLPADNIHLFLEAPGGATYGDPMPTGSQIHYRRVMLTDDFAGYWMTLWVDLSQLNHQQQQMNLALTVLLGGALAVAALLTIPGLNFALRPLRQVGEAAQRIVDGERGLRLNPTQRHTEIGRTAVAIDDMLDALEGSEARAQQAQDQMTRFLSDAAHELKTPLAGIQAASESLMSLPPDAVDEREELEYLLGREANRAGVLVGSLLEAARVDAGLALHPEMFDLHELLEAERGRIGLTRPEVRVTVRPGSLRVMADRPAMTSAVRNVLENAARMAGSGGWVEMWVTGRPASLTTAKPTDMTAGQAEMGQPNTPVGQAEMWIIDSGPGVAPADRERIFDRLVRLDVPQNRQGGSGLGLPIARGYLRAMGGDLVCTDPPSDYRAPTPDGGVGAAFKLTLPVTLRATSSLT